MHINIQPITSKLQLAIVINKHVIIVRIQHKQEIKIKAYETVKRVIILGQ